MKLGSRRLNVPSTSYAFERLPAGLRKDEVAVTSLLGFLRLALVAALEHLEHAVGDEEAADDVDRPEGDRDDEQELRQEAVDAEAQHDDAAEHDDAVDGVGARHQWRVQRVGHLGDGQKAGEAGQDEDRQVGQQHQACTVSPSRTTHAPATTASSKSMARLPSSSISSSSRAWTLRA